MGAVRRTAASAALVTVAAVLVATPAAAAGATLTRSPWLTDTVGSVARVTWATDSAGTSTVVYGTAPGCTGHSATAPAPTQITVGGVAEQQYSAQLAALASATAYCYKIQQDGADVAGGTGTFTSAVATGQSAPLSFAVLGDWGEATGGVNDDQSAILQGVADSGATFALGTGDIGYPGGTQTDYGDLQNTGGNSEVFGPGFWGVPGRSVPMFTVIGNHGWNSTFLQNWPQGAAVAASGGAYGADGNGSNPAAWYAFDQGTTRFYILEAASASGSTQYADDDAQHWAGGAAERTWLQKDLTTHPNALKIAVFHYPLYSDSPSETSDTFLQDDLLPILTQYGVRLVFNGHAHLYERNTRVGSGPITYVTGGAGADVLGVGPCTLSNDAYAIGWGSNNTGRACGSAPVPTSESQVHHFLSVSLNGGRVTVTPTDATGRTFDEQTYNFAPTAPGSLKPTGGDAHVALSWAAPSSNGGLAIRDYTVFRSTAAGVLGSALATGVTATSYDDTGLTNGTTYYYSVLAYNGGGAAGPTATTSATPRTVPTAPTHLAAIPGNGQVSLSWQPPTNDGGSPVTGYTVYRSSTPGPTGTALKAGLTGTSYVDTTAAPSTTYYYSVAAINGVGAGTGPPSAQVSAHVPTGKPGAPSALTATPANGTVTLSWQPPADDGGGAISGYTVYRSAAAGSAGTKVATGVAGTSYVDTTVARLSTYFYSVTATNPVGEGPASAQVSASVPSGIPAGPSTPTAVAGDRQVTLSWQPPVDTGDAPVTSYTVYRSTSPGLLGSAVGTTGAPAFSDGGVVNGTTYYYAVTAHNVFGESTASAQTSVMPRGSPTVGITSGPSRLTRNATGVISFSTVATNALPVATTCRLDTGAWSSCSSGQTYSGLADGTHSLTVMPSDATGPGTAVTHSWTVDTRGPRVTVTPLARVTLGRTVVRWHGADAGSGVASYDVRYRRAARNGRFGTWSAPSGWQALRATTFSRIESAGFTDCFAVRARDAAGNVGGWSAPTCTTIPLDDRSLTRSRGWTRVAKPAFYAGTVTNGRAAGATLTLRKVTATRLALVATKCPRCGTVRVYLGGHLVSTVSLRAARVSRRSIVLLPATGRRQGTLAVRITTSGRLVQVDGVAALP